MAQPSRPPTHPPRRLSDGRCEAVRESGTVTSLHLSACGRWLATNLTDASVHAWQLPDLAAGPGQRQAAACSSSGDGHSGAASAAPGGAGPAGLRGGDPLDALPALPAFEFRMGASRRPNRYVLRCCVGGARSGFVAAGSEDSSLFIWWVPGRGEMCEVGVAVRLAVVGCAPCRLQPALPAAGAPTLPPGPSHRISQVSSHWRAAGGAGGALGHHQLRGLEPAQPVPAGLRQRRRHATDVAGACRAAAAVGRPLPCILCTLYALFHVP